jgi:nucleotide-binding universal stress UspA family protein
VVDLHNRILEENLAIEGTIAEKIIQATTLPVLIVKTPPHGPYSKVVIGVDFSAFSRAAVAEAMGLAPGASYVLAHAYQTPLFPGLAAGGDGAIERQLAAARKDRLQRFIMGELDALKEHTSAPGRSAPTIETRSVEGDPRQVLKEEVRANGADLLVLGTHGRVGVTRAIVGSVATDLINDRLCDVLVVKPY